MKPKSFLIFLLSGVVPFSAPAIAADPVDPSIVALAPVPEGKLTDAVKPIAYRIDTRFDPAQETFSGTTEIDIDLKAPQSWIDLHGRDLRMTSIVARPTGSGEARWTGIWHQVDDSGVGRIVFPAQLPQGKLTLAFDYTGKIYGNGTGLYRAKVGEDWYGWSQFQSIDARAAFPGFDEPGFKTPFTVNLRTPAGQSAVSNAPQVSNTLEDGWQVHRFAPTLPLPTYLVAMMVGPHVTVDSAVPPTPERAEPLPLRIVSTRQNDGKLEYALENSKAIVALLEDYFGEAFPYPKLDQITSPLIGGAMENAGADLYNDYILVLDEVSPVPQKKFFGMVVAHELAHQWFGDMVTPAWWDDLWLNESFASWMGYHIGGLWRPDLKIGEGGLTQGFTAMATDELVAGRPIHQPVLTSDQTDSVFDTITYGKGGHVISMIAAFLGPERFQAGVRRYMDVHRHGNAATADFFSALAAEAGDPRITESMIGFVDQQGIPLVTIGGKPRAWTLSQSRYAPIGVTPPETRWGVPVCMRMGEARDCTLLAEASGTLALTGDGPLMPNADGTGYYRFELPATQWDALIASADTLPGVEAVAAMDSLSASFRAGRASMAQLVALTEKLSANPDPTAANAALGPLGEFRRAGMLDADATAHYRKWVGDLARADFAKLGFDPRAGAYDGADPDEVQRRKRAVGDLSLAHDAQVEGKLAGAARAYLAGDATALDPAYFGDAFGAYLAQDKLAAAKALVAAALASEDPAFRPAALYAVAGSGDPAVARWLLDEMTDERLRETEAMRLKLGVVGTAETRALGYEWLTANAAGLMASANGIFLARSIPGVVGGFCSAEQADEVAATFRPVVANTSAELELERSIERIRNCAALKAARGAEINAALKAID